MVDFHYQEAGTTGNGAALPQAVTVDAGRGLSWFGDGLALVLKQPGTWALISLIYLLIAIPFQFVPVIGPLAFGLFAQVFVGGLFLGADALWRGDSLQVSHLFAAFSKHLGSLIVVVLLAWLAAAIFFAVFGGAGFLLGAFDGMGPGQWPEHWGRLLVLCLLAAIALSLLGMGFYFATPLIVLGGYQPIAALKASFQAVLWNWAALLVFFLVMLAAMIVLGLACALLFGLIAAISAAMAAVLGFLVLIPMLLLMIPWSIGIMYSSYRDMFR